MPVPDAVTNAGPLIYLAALNRFCLLKDLLGDLHLPQAVYEEVVTKGRG